MIKIRNKILFLVISAFIVTLITAVAIKMNNDAQKQAETNETNEKDDEKEKNDELDDFVIIENTDEKKEDELKAVKRKSDENDF